MSGESGKSCNRRSAGSTDVSFLSRERVRSTFLEDFKALLTRTRTRLQRKRRSNALVQ